MHEGAGTEISILSARGIEHRSALHRDDDSGTWPLALDAATTHRLIRLEVREPYGALVAMTNPIYLEAD